MDWIEKLKSQLAGLSLSPVSDSDIQAMRNRYADLPEDYCRFLREIGHGNLGEIQLYTAPVDPDSIYPNISQPLKEVVLFGDDFQGNCFGFLTTSKCRIVEVDGRGNVDTTIEPDFRSLMNGYFAG